MSDVVWRYNANPIIPRHLISSANSTFNSAAVSFQGAFVGVFRCDNQQREMNPTAASAMTCPTWPFPAPRCTTSPAAAWPIFYRGADTLVALAFGYMDELLDWLKRNSAR